ncbi:hypothetical protein BZG36_04974 [Bifiguratus adelaidae]|uniref:Alpha/beta hydrolase fold-3 domain-containing protein n=1 Tax=Bifiguratus adelaidae TaxID=1938954 RepID=A0A261XV46_9FUNG|nr:hypothetical protein BZG36_04974 [Bifiguratus adelaidae]
MDAFINGLAYTLSYLPISVQAKTWRTLANAAVYTGGGGAYEERPLNTKAGPVRLLMYKPETSTAKAPWPVYYNIHGGGWTIGRPEMDNFWCRRVADEVGCVVVAVDYCKAPEHPYPEALEQCYEILRWIADTSADGGATLCSLNPEKVAIGGFSAGGNLTLTTALKFIQDKDISAKLVLLNAIYPAIDLVTPYADKMKRVSPHVQTKSIPEPMAHLYNVAYTVPGREGEPLCSPKYASNGDLAQFPRTLVLAADLDCLYVEAQEFADQLRQAGVDVVFQLYPNSIHGFTYRRPGQPDYNPETKEASIVLSMSELKKAFA